MTGQRHIRARIALSAGCAAVACAALTAGTGTAAASPDPVAQAARTLNITESASLKLVRKSGTTLYEKGTATGTLPGRVEARFEVTLTKVTGSVTIYPNSGGSLTINIVGRPTSAGTNARFEGTMAVRRGTGRYADAVGSGTFSGTVNRRSWDASVTAKARLTY